MNPNGNVPSAGGFGTLLRAWRTARRLSQLELALHCEVSQRHLSFLESGRARPSRRMVLALTEALDVPLRERNGMLHAAGFAAHFAQSALDGAAMTPIREALARMLRFQEPFPAVVVNSDFDLVMNNGAFDRLLGLLAHPDEVWRACCGAGPRNMLRLTFSEQGLRPAILNFEVLAPLLLNRVWREAVVRGAEIGPVLRGLRNDAALQPYWQASPAEHDAVPPVLPVVLGQGDLRLSLFSMISTFGTPYDVTTDELRVESFFPADAQTETLMRELHDRGARGPGP